MTGFKKKGQRGFTLIELLVVVAILGVLAAVVVPNVGKFIGSGKTESGLTELQNVQTAVTAMMADTSQTTVTAGPVAPVAATNDMTAWPLPAGNELFGGATNYVSKPTTQYFYETAADGTVTGYWLADRSKVIGVDPAP